VGEGDHGEKPLDGVIADLDNEWCDLELPE